MIYSVVLLTLLLINVLTLTNAKVHDALYKAISHLPLSAITKNSPTKRFNRLSNQVKDRNQHLLNQNKQLHKKKIANKRAVKKLSQKISKRMVLNVSRNILSVPGEAVPILGVGLMIAVTASDVLDACNTMKDMDAIMLTLGGEGKDSNTNKICGQTVPSEKEVLLKLAVTKRDYAEMQHNLGGFLHHTQQETEKRLGDFNKVLGKALYELIN